MLVDVDQRIEIVRLFTRHEVILRLHSERFAECLLKCMTPLSFFYILIVVEGCRLVSSCLGYLLSHPLQLLLRVVHGLRPDRSDSGNVQPELPSPHFNEISVIRAPVILDASLATLPVHDFNELQLQE